MKAGTHHWWMQRVTSGILLFLSVWFVYTFVETPLTTFASAHQWLKNPLNALGVALGLFTGLYHGALGLQVVIEDYVHCSVGKVTLLIISKVGFVCLALIGGYALLKIHGIGV